MASSAPLIFMQASLMTDEKYSQVFSDLELLHIPHRASHLPPIFKYKGEIHPHRKHRPQSSGNTYIYVLDTSIEGLGNAFQCGNITIPEVRRYRSYEEPDETPNRGAQFGSWLPHVMWYFVSQQRGCKWVFVWTLQRSIKFQTPRRRDLHQQAQTNGVVKRSSMGVRAHETPNQGAQFGKCWHWPALLPPQLASLYSAIANSK